MSFDVILAIILISTMLILLFMGVHIAWAIGITALIGFLLIGQPLSQFAWSTWSGLFSFTLTAKVVPFFIE